VEYDITDLALPTDERDESLRWLRHNDPLHWDEKNGYWLVTRHADVLRVSKDPTLFSSVPKGPFLVRAMRDTELGGKRIGAGESVVMVYASANRDEAVFDDPHRFRVDRTPNRHVGFGYGEHFCLGAHLARQSQRALVDELIRRVDHIELAGEPDWIQSSFVVGLKHLPIRYRFK
jgi:cytochrome P450